MHIQKYFLEIKNRIILIIFTWLLLFIITYIYKEFLLFLFFKPILNNNSMISNCFIFTNITEIFSVYLNLILFISNQIIFLFILYHFWNFILPGLYFNEKKIIKYIVFITILIWIFSILILYNIILPASFNFFLGFQNVNVYFEAKINEYLEFYLTFYRLWIINSQILSLIICLLFFLDITNSFIKKSRKLFYALFVILATLITPPDIFSQLFSILILGFVYELFILFKVITKKLMR